MQVKYNSLQGEEGTYIQTIDLVYVWPIGFPSNKHLPGLQNIP